MKTTPRDPARGRGIPLCVDLDGTLTPTDTLHESLLRVLFKPRLLPKLIRASFGGKAALKGFLAEAARPDPQLLPYRQDLLGFLKAEYEKGRPIVLATASHKLVAEGVARHLGIFSDVMATEGRVNLRGEAKRDALVAAYGSRGFDYVGDSAKDLPIFEAARLSHLADPSRRLERRVRARARIGESFRRGDSPLGAAAKALRIHQWSKNALVFVPLLASHRVFEAKSLVVAAIACICFCLQASAIYIVNDLHDLDADRRHPKKRNRPLASGRLSIPAGSMLAPIFAAASLSVGTAFVGLPFAAILVGYAILSLAYSFDLKRRLVVDALALASLYSIRLFGGAVALAVTVSEWLLLFSLFFFFSLALLKRYVELNEFHQERLSGRGYVSSDLGVLLSIGTASGFLSILVMGLYIASPSVTQLYKSPRILWLLCPLLIYWISRIWFLAGRGLVDHDPIVFAVTDARSYVVAALFGLVLVCATLGGS